MTDQLLQSDKNLTGIKYSYDNLIEKILKELESHKEEQTKFKEQLLTVIEDNNRIGTKIDSIQSTRSSESDRKHEQLTSDAIANLKQQVNGLKEERCTIKQLLKTSQDTIANLETEIANYRNQLFKPSAFSEIKQKYCSTIKTLEDVITSQKNEISKQAYIIRDFSENQNRTRDRVSELQAVIIDQESKIFDCQQLERSNSDLKQKLQSALNANTELEMSTTLARTMIDERFVREKNALEKLQEALLIAETAVAEKEEALKRELVVKEECETLATTIGQVMEEAARKVEQNVAALKMEFEEKERVLISRHQQAVAEVEMQMSAARSAEDRCYMLEQKLNELLRDNNELNHELQMASQAIVNLNSEMELKLEATENLRREDKSLDKICEEREQQIRQYMDNNHKLKERWKNTVEDVANKFGNEIQRLQMENSSLKAEIQSQRLKVYKQGN